MKKCFLLLLVFCGILMLTACSARVEEMSAGFRIDSWNSSLGGTSKNTLDETKYSYQLTISSETEDLRTVTAVYPILGEAIVDRVISNEPPQMTFYDDYIDVRGDIILDTKDLNSKEYIMALEPYIVRAKIITEQTVELRLGGDD